MLQVIAAIIYISVLCWVWGQMLLNTINLYLNHQNSTPVIAVEFSCLTGLSFIGIVLQVLCLFMPLGGWGIHLLFALPPLLFYFRNRHLSYLFINTLRHRFSGLNIAGWAFFITGSLFVLAIHPWYVINPDTTGYHAPIIEWTLQYGTVPGIANLNGRLGLSSSWFILSAFFKFDFTGTGVLTFINAVVLIWCISYTADVLNQQIRNQSGFIIVTIILIAFIFGIYTMIYQAASSASPDFIICIFLWSAFILLLNTDPKREYAMESEMALIILAFAVTLKISAAPAILLLPLIYKKIPSTSSFKKILFISIPIILSLGAFLARNIIISGYPLFPSTMFNWFNVDWKFSPQLAKEIEIYITAFAKAGSVEWEGYKDITNLKFSEWSLLWWSALTFMEKLFFLSVLVSISFLLLNIKKIFASKTLGWITIVCLISSILWMTKVPALRFSQAYLLPLILISAWLMFDRFKSLIPKRYPNIAVIILIIFIGGYSIYRFYTYFDAVNIVRPYGTINSPGSFINCNGIYIFIPQNPNGCGSNPLPCAYNSCETFEPRGPGIADGFRSKK